MKRVIAFANILVVALSLNAVAQESARTVLVSNPVYSHDGQHVLVPEGTIVLGEAKKIGANGFGQQRRIAVTFHRMIMPDGYSVDLDQFRGLDQIGEEALKDKVNNHYLEIFGTSIALGVIGGAGEIAQGGGAISTNGSQAFTTGAASGVSQSATTVLDRFIQIPPTITIREGHRVPSPGVDAEPAVVVPGVQDESKTIVNLRYEFVRFGGNQGVCLEAGTVGPLPRVPDAGEGKRSEFGEGDGENTLDGLGGLRLFLDLAGSGMPKRSPDPAESSAAGSDSGSGSYVGLMACPGFGHSYRPLAGTRQRRLAKGSRQILLSVRPSDLALMVESALNSSSLLANQGTMPQRTITNSRSPVSRLRRMTGWKSPGATL
jgi:hypothetical protein